MDDDERWFTVSDVAERYQVSEETVRRWIRAGELPALNVGGQRPDYRIKPDDIEVFVKGRYGTFGKPKQRRESDR